MPVSIDISGFKISISDKDALSGGTLGDDVYVQFVCTTTDGGHTADGIPDDHVRASHAAFHGRIFTITEAPVPPLDYGCRCAIRYVAAPGSPMEGVLPVTATAEPITPEQATAAWLEANVPDIDALRTLADTSRSVSSIGAVTNELKRRGIKDSRLIANMLIDSRSEAR